MAELLRVALRTASQEEIKRWTEPKGTSAAMDVVKGRFQKWDGPYRQRDRGKKWDPWTKNEQQTLKDFRDGIVANKVGDVRVLEDKSGALILVRNVHVIDVDFPNISSNATPRAKALVEPLWTEFPQLEYWGCYNCRRIDGSSSWSQHAWADAIDIHAPTMSYGDEVFRWLMANRGRFGITRVLWRISGHFGHLHIDLDPDHSGTPPCA